MANEQGSGGPGRPRAIITSTVPITLDRFHRELIRQVATTHEVHAISSGGEELEALRDSAASSTHAIEMAREVSPKRDLVSALRWWATIRKIQPSLIITATPKASLIGQVVARARAVPQRLYYVGGLRLEGERGAKRRLLWVMEWLTARSATHVVANSPSLGRELLRLRITKSAKLHLTAPGSGHGVDTQYFSPQNVNPVLATEIGLSLDIPVVGFLGRITADKGVLVLLRACEILYEQGRRVQLLLVGAQDERDSNAILEVIRNSAVKASVCPQVSDPRPFLAFMTVHALPSFREGFPNAVLEAAAMGIPSVTTDATGAIDSVLDGVTGCVVPVGDADELATALAHIIGNSGLRSELGNNAREWAVNEFQPSKVVATILEPLGLPATTRQTDP